VILSIGECEDDGEGDNNSILIEIHMDEVAIQLLSTVRDTGNSIGVPVWKGEALGNSKFHVWGEKMDILSMPSQTLLGTGFIV
jgi:putative aminopeptidase FrvX/DNA-directed RNA polymerase subunit M/transcription elongation factor TFIIS